MLLLLLYDHIITFKRRLSVLSAAVCVQLESGCCSDEDEAREACRQLAAKLGGCGVDVRDCKVSNRKQATSCSSKAGWVCM